MCHFLQRINSLWVRSGVNETFRFCKQVSRDAMFKLSETILASVISPSYWEANWYGSRNSVLLSVVKSLQVGKSSMLSTNFPFLKKSLWNPSSKTSCFNVILEKTGTKDRGGGKGYSQIEGSQQHRRQDAQKKARQKTSKPQAENIKTSGDHACALCFSWNPMPAVTPAFYGPSVLLSPDPSPLLQKFWNPFSFG